MAVTASAPPGAGSERALGSPRREPTSRSADRYVLGLVVVIAAVFLATRLGLIWRLPPGWDETGYGEWANSAAQSASTRWLSMLEGKEPLTSWLGALWVHAGVHYLTAVRLVSLVSGAISLSMLWLIGRRLGTQVALVAMALYAALPLFVVHDSTGLMEPTVTAFSLCVLYLAIRIAERPRLDMALLLGLATGAGLLTKESGQFALAMVPLGLLVFDWRRKELAPRLARWLGAIAVAAAACAACWSILLLSPNWDAYRAARDQFHRPLGKVLGDPWNPISSNGHVIGALASYVGPLLLALAAVGLVLAVARRRRLSLLVALWGGLPFLGSLLLVATGPYPRYWVPALAPLCLTMAEALSWLIGLARMRVARGAPRQAAVAVLVALAVVPPAVLLGKVLAAPTTAHYPGLDDSLVTSWAAGTGWKDVAAYLDARTGDAPFTIAYDRARPLWVFLHHADRAQQIPIGTPPAASAQFLVKNYSEPLSPAEKASFRLVRSFPRPRHGQPILLYAHR